MDLLTSIVIPNKKKWFKTSYTYALTIEPGRPTLVDVLDHRIWSSSKKLWTYRTNSLRKSHVLHIVNKMCKYKFSITEQEFYSICESRYSDYCKRKEYQNKPVNTLIRYKEIQREQFRMIEKWNLSTPKERQSLFSICKFGNRLHSPFTCIMKELRHYVYDQHGNKFNFGELDIVTSQFTIYANILLERGIDCKYVSVVKKKIKNDKDEYPDFHQYMADEKHISRELCKTDNYSLMFCKPTNPNHKEFCRIFPVAGKELTEDKKKRFSGLPTYIFETKDNYKSVACILQQKESKIMKLVWKSLYDSDIDFLPVHDAVYVDTEKLDEAIEIMKECLDNELSFCNIKTPKGII